MITRREKREKERRERGGRGSSRPRTQTSSKKGRDFGFIFFVFPSPEGQVSVSFMTWDALVALGAFSEDLRSDLERDFGEEQVFVAL